MTPRELQVISALAVFLTASLPAAAGAIAFRTQPILAATLTGEPGKLPGLTGLFFNNFKAALLLLMFLGAAATIVAIRTHFNKEAEAPTKMATLVVTTCFSSLLSVIFLALLILATVMPVYAKLMQR
ncbi:MAG: hypothetical protein WCJ96_07010 [Verrucomicrobiota bacterium]|jgi:hypothetical protein